MFPSIVNADVTPRDRQRFEKKVQIDLETGCWVWIGALSRAGYGQFSWQGKVRIAPRVAYTWWRGEIPAGLHLDHCVCKYPRCVNPWHLEAVTQRVNNERSACVGTLNAQVTHCPRGHPYDDANTEYHDGGRRRCVTCRRLDNRIRSVLYNGIRAAKRQAAQEGRVLTEEDMADIREALKREVDRRLVAELYGVA